MCMHVNVSKMRVKIEMNRCTPIRRTSINEKGCYNGMEEGALYTVTFSLHSLPKATIVSLTYVPWLVSANLNNDCIGVIGSLITRDYEN